MANLKAFIKKIPLVNLVAGNPDKHFKGTANYWEERYHEGGNSGAGSYNRLAEFKAEFLNAFIVEKNIKEAIEFGCGDGNQAEMIHYPSYVGFDISKTAINICIDKFSNDPSKSFFLYDSRAFKDNKNIFKADLTLSLDVLYHIIEDDLFEKYISHLFNASSRYVIIYSNDFDDRSASHVRERKFTEYVAAKNKNWKLIDRVRNKYPYDPKDPDNTSSADFYIYEKV